MVDTRHIEPSDFEGASLEQMRSWVESGSADGLYDKTDGWKGEDAYLRELKTRLEDKLTEVGVVMQSESGEAMKNQAVPVVLWTEVAADNARAQSELMTQQGDAFSKVQSSIPGKGEEKEAPDSNWFKDTWDSMVNGQTDAEAAQQHNEKLRQEAVQAFRAYDNTSQNAVAGNAQFTPPPDGGMNVTVTGSQHPTVGGVPQVSSTPSGTSSQWAGGSGTGGGGGSTVPSGYGGGGGSYPGGGGGGGGVNPGGGVSPGGTTPVWRQPGPGQGGPTPIRVPGGSGPTGPGQGGPTPIRMPGGSGPTGPGRGGPSPIRMPGGSGPNGPGQGGPNGPGGSRVPGGGGPGGGPGGRGGLGAGGAGGGSSLGAGGRAGGLAGPGGTGTGAGGVGGAGGAGGAGGRGGMVGGAAGARPQGKQGEEDQEHAIPDYLKGDHGFFDDDLPKVAPPVFGEWEQR